MVTVLSDLELTLNLSRVNLKQGFSWILPCGWAGQSSPAQADPYPQRTGCWRSALIPLRWKRWRGCHQWFPLECPQTWESRAGRPPLTSPPVKKEMNRIIVATFNPEYTAQKQARHICNRGWPPVSPPEASSVPGSWWTPPPSVGSLWSALASAASGGIECEGSLKGKHRPAYVMAIFCNIYTYKHQLDSTTNRLLPSLLNWLSIECCKNKSLNPEISWHFL